MNSAHDSSEAARDDKGRKPSTEPVIEAGAVYLREQVIERFRTTNDTFRKWMQAGLPVFKPMTSSQVVIGDDLIEFIRQFPVGERE